MPQKTDSQLVRTARAGSKPAFGELMTRYQAMARRLALDTVGSEDIAQELVQEAMLQAYLSLAHLRDDARFRSWLCGIVLNVCRNWLRDQKTCLPPGIGFPNVFAPDPQALAEEREQRHLIRQAVEGLSPQNREAVLRFYYEQWSLQEIAADLGISVVAVKGRLHKGRRQLRARLQPLYPNIKAVLPTKRKGKFMVGVTVTGVYMHQAEGNPAQYFVLLADESDRRLAIWVGQFEAWAISFGLDKAGTERPMTIDLMANLLRETDGTLEEVRIEALKDETFYAILKVRTAGGVREVDARPSDAIALALRTDAPLYVTEQVLETAGSTFSANPDESGEVSLLGPNLPAPQDGPVVLISQIAMDEATIRHMTDAILHQAIREGANEVMFGTGIRSPAVRILYRIGADVTEAMTITESTLKALIANFRSKAGMGSDDPQTVRDGWFPFHADGKNYRVRVFLVRIPAGDAETLSLRPEP